MLLVGVITDWLLYGGALGAWSVLRVSCATMSLRRWCTTTWSMRNQIGGWPREWFADAHLGPQHACMPLPCCNPSDVVRVLKGGRCCGNHCEARRRGTVKCHISLYTAAPETCDLPGTHTVYAQVGATPQGELVRLVEVPILVFIRQWQRYTAGGHLVTESTSWHVLAQHG